MFGAHDLLEVAFAVFEGPPKNRRRGFRQRPGQRDVGIFGPGLQQQRRDRVRIAERQGVIAHQTKAIEAAFSVADRASAKFPEAPTIGEIAIACAIGYLDIRAPNDGWRERYPQLASWLEKFSRYPSVEATKPPG